MDEVLTRRKVSPGTDKLLQKTLFSLLLLLVEDVILLSLCSVKSNNKVQLPPGGHKVNLIS